MAATVYCYKCKKDIELIAGSKVGRSDECPHCQIALRCCKMCSFYDTLSYNDCREPSAERVVEKEKANFCDYFNLGNAGNDGKSKDDIVNAANSLFKD